MRGLLMLQLRAGVGSGPDTWLMTSHVSRADRTEMLRAHAGLVTTMVAVDEVARNHLLAAVVREHAEKSVGDVGAFTALMAKQVEAGALVTHSVLRMLARRLDLTDQETQEVIAQAIASVDEADLPK